MQTPTDHATIIRVQKAANYSIISNHHLQNPDLSWKAKGLLTYLLSKPDNWQIRVNQLAKASTDGIDSVRSGINELRQTGYIALVSTRDDSGKFLKWEYLVYEIPEKLENKEIPSRSEKSGYGRTQAGKTPRLINTEKKQARKKTTTEGAAVFSGKSAEEKHVSGHSDIPAVIIQALGSIPGNERAFVQRANKKYGIDAVLKAVKYTQSMSPENFYGYLRSCLESGYGSNGRPGKHPATTYGLKEFKIDKPKDLLTPEEIKVLIQTRRAKTPKRSTGGQVDFNEGAGTRKPGAVGSEAVKLLVESLKTAGRNLKEIAAIIPEAHRPVFRQLYGPC